MAPMERVSRDDAAVADAAGAVLVGVLKMEAELGVGDGMLSVGGVLAAGKEIALGEGEAVVGDVEVVIICDFSLAFPPSSPAD